MKPLLIATTVALLAFTGSAVADEPGKEARKAYEEAQREAWKDRNEAAREYAKDRREALKEQEKEYRRWARGEHIPRDYLVDRYYVRDYRAYDLAPPPPGYVYVRPYQDDETFYLVQLATGLISMILGN